MKLLPDEIPEDASPIEATSLIDLALPMTDPRHGKNMIVSLLTGETLVGRVELHNALTREYTVGNSDPIKWSLVHSSRET